MSDTTDTELVALRIAKEVRAALERAALAVEGLAGNNRHYQAMCKRAAFKIRSMKPD